MRRELLTHLEELSGTPIDTDTLALVQIGLVVLGINAFSMTRVDQSVTRKGTRCKRFAHLQHTQN